MPTLKAGFATLKHEKLSCPQCTRKIVHGVPVVVLSQGPLVPYWSRVIVFHDDCVRDLLPAAAPKIRAARKKKLPVPQEKVVQELATVYGSLRHRSRAETLAWLEETGPNGDLMRWSPPSE